MSGGSEDGIPLKKDGNPDMRYKAAREAVGDDAGEGQGKPAGGTAEDGTPLRKDGQPDQRYSSEHGFGADRERASEEGKKGGSTQPDEVYKPSEHGGLREDGQPDQRKSSEHGFGADRERASEEGKKGGHSS